MSSNAHSANNKMQPATCTFVVNKFSSCHSYNSSSVFSSPSYSAAFQLCMNPAINMSFMSTTTHWSGNNVSYSLYFNTSPNQGPLTVRYRMSIVNANAEKCNTQEGIIKFTKASQFGGQYIISRDILLDTANGWLVNDKLTVYCEVYLVDSDLDQNTVTNEPSSMSQDYGSLFESDKLSDVVLVAGATEFKVHKAILSARSAVFGAMFEHDTKEKQENRIEIKNETAEAYHELLRYIYTDKVDNLKENALELMVAADKYQLDHLKSICEEYLCANLSTESVAITLVMADLHRAEALKSKCFEHISNNARDVKATEGWKTLSAKPELFTEVFLYVTDKINK